MTVHAHNIRCWLLAVLMLLGLSSQAQINTEQVLRIGQNALYFDDYMLSIQYFNQVIGAKPYLAQPWLLRAIAKLNLDDYLGAEKDASKAIELNPYITDAFEVRGVARQNLGKDSLAILDYQEALQLLPRNRQLLFNLAMAEESIGRYPQADSTYERLLGAFPAFDNGYVGRAKLRLAQGDTIRASQDIDKALSLNRNAVNAYIMRAEIAIHHDQALDSALSDMDHAVKLMPRQAGLYINRAYLRYRNDDYHGAMADYDYALRLDPLNLTALFNRGLMYAEVGANDRALADFNKVLELTPGDLRAIYNRSQILSQKHRYAEAINDINKIIEAYPDFGGAYMMRSQQYRESGNTPRAMADYDKAMALMRKRRPTGDTSDASDTSEASEAPSNPFDDDTPEAISRRFASLLTVENDTEIDEEFNNKDIRGKVQDRNVAIEMSPMMELTYHTAPTELQQGSQYMPEVDDLNATRALRRVVAVSNNLPTLDQEDVIADHFKSIEYYTAYIDSHQPRAIDYLGRALDYVTVRNYDAAIADLNRAIAAAPDYAVGYVLRSQVRWHQLKDGRGNPETDPATATQLRRKAYDDVIADLRKVIELSPRNALAHYNLGNVYADLQDYTTALQEYNAALAGKPDLGDAYFNRGYVLLQLGDKAAAVADLSRAGELGILPSYNLLKRIR